jgi:L-aminopeptidase/D-esterase-like protein
MLANARPGPTNTLVDVAGIRVGHATLVGNGFLTGTTVVLTPPEGAIAGVDVRGAAPGTRETDLLDPRNLVEKVNAVIFTGGSAYGLATADGVMQKLAAADRGFPVGPGPGEVVPIVPAAVIFDLARGGDFAKRPTSATGAAAYDAAISAAGADRVQQGNVGAGTGAVAGGLKGGVGSASVVLDGVGTVGALAVVNAVGSTVDPVTGGLYGARCGLPGEFDPALLDRPNLVLPDPGKPSLSTTIVAMATDVALTKARCSKLAGVGHDGLSRAIRPVHTMFDGDTVFAVATGVVEPDIFGFHALLDVAGDCVSRAIAHAMLAAKSVTTKGGHWPSYRDLSTIGAAR